MAGVTVRVSNKTGEILREMARQAGKPMQTILDKAVEEYRRKYFLEEANRAFASLKSNPEAWREEMEEREGWESAIGDDLGGED